MYIFAVGHHLPSSRLVYINKLYSVYADWTVNQFPPPQAKRSLRVLRRDCVNYDLFSYDLPPTHKGKALQILQNSKKRLRNK